MDAQTQLVAELYKTLNDAGGKSNAKKSKYARRVGCR